jgi:phenylpyruvate tautomerase PptA (4-oxalocrotonate tautomerase family)
MPIVDVEIVSPADEVFPAELAPRLANRLGEVFGSPPGNTWVKVRAFPARDYAENGQGGENDMYPVFVSVLKAHLPRPEQMQAEVAALTLATAEICRRLPENVHIIYLPKGAGRVAFGGKIVQ